MTLHPEPCCHLANVKITNYITLHCIRQHRRSRGCSGSTCTPRAVKKFFFRRNLQGKCVSAPPVHEVHPQPEQELMFRTFFVFFLDLEAYIDRVLRATTKKVVQSIYAKKMAEPKTNCNSNENYTKSCEILCSITYSKSAKIKLLELTVFLFFSARLKTLDRATAKVVLSVCPSLCHAPNSFCNIR